MFHAVCHGKGDKTEVVRYVRDGGGHSVGMPSLISSDYMLNCNLSDSRATTSDWFWNSCYATVSTLRRTRSFFNLKF
jgi:hypothetical protein